MCGFMLKLTGVRRLLCVASTFDSVFSFPSASGNSSAPEHNLFLVKFDNDDDLGERNRGYIRRHHPHAHTAGICRDVGDCKDEFENPGADEVQKGPRGLHKFVKSG
ncbi:uncharacterized protein LOC119170833 isoform X6 [Rhipicephalus microplus]|uniref:uncharacterized protein LOC119170833 isoform X6 n=1 Tax=Rhipicephalus microplus TaxID=6941 RepID=UPI003F6B8944